MTVDEIVKGVLSEGVIECPEVAQVADVLSLCAVVFRLCHVEVCHAGIAFAEPVHHQFISFLRDIHRLP